MSYTINPNAKNKWARNAENTMDLSLETDASSVYLDNGRTLEQEIGEGSMVSNVATIDTSMSKVIDGTLDGAYESLVFKGKSLVNVIGKITVSNNAIDNRDGSYTINKNTVYSRINILGGNPMIKVNTPYYFTVIVSNGTLTNLNIDVGTSVTKQQLGNGKYLITLTEKSFNIEANRLFWYQSLGTTSQETVTIYPILVEYQQGMENWDIPYFTGICDSKMPILRNVGKNLLSIQDYSPKGTLTNVEVTQNTLKATAEGMWHGFEYILQLKPNTEYTFSFERDSDTVRGYIRHPENKGWTGGYGGHSNYIFTTRDTGVIRFTIESSLANNTIVVRNPMIVEGNLCPISYENYKTNILRTSEEIVLREVGGVCDTYNPLTGEYIKRIGEIVLNGSENWSQIALTNKDDYLAFGTPLLPKGITTNYNTNNIIDSHGFSKLQLDYADNGSRLGEAIIIHNNGNLYFRMLKTRLSTANKDGWLSYLQLSPITVQYKLAEPITTIVEPLTIPFAYQNGHVILESGFEGQSLLPTLEYSTVVNKTGLVENVAKTIQRQEKQLTMLEQMLIQNIINLDYNNTLLTLKNEMEEML